MSTTLVVSFVLALVAAGIFRYVLVSSMSNVASATKADAYLEQGTFALTEKEDTFLYKTVNRRAKPKKNDD